MALLKIKNAQGEWESVPVIKGDPFIYSDFTPEQIAELQRPATDAAADATEVVAGIEQDALAFQQTATTLINNKMNDVDTAEGLRNTAETTRGQNEQGRVIAEGTRQQNETARGNAEDDREDAEALRLSAEITRVQNEQARITAESTRQTNTAIAIQNAETATTNAENAAILAIEVAEHPDTILNDYWHKWNTTTNAYETTGIKAKGDTGKSAYQSYFDTTTDNPKLTEQEWGNLMTGILNVLNSI